MALEDGASLGVLLSKITSLSQIKERFEVFQSIRFERTAATQILSNVGFDEVEQIHEEAVNYVKLPREPHYFY